LLDQTRFLSSFVSGQRSPKTPPCSPQHRSAEGAALPKVRNRDAARRTEQHALHSAARLSPDVTEVPPFAIRAVATAEAMTRQNTAPKCCARGPAC
jgi:hypothetical protein